MLTEDEAIEQIKQGNLQLLPLRIELVKNDQWQKEIDAVVSVIWAKRTYLFAAEYKALSTPKEFASAIDQALRFSQANSLSPMVLMPYLNEHQLNELAERQISGIDFSGNGIVIVPNQLLVFRQGKPNLFPASAAIKNIYRKNSSIVSRAFLVRPTFDSVNSIKAFIQMHGGHEAAISLSTVSKVLKALEEDLIISREKGVIRLIQPEKLLDKLVVNFARPLVRSSLVGKSPYNTEALMRLLSENSLKHQVWLAGTGIGSISQYAVMARENFLSVYCTDQYRLMTGIEFKETNRFPNLEIMETQDKTVYFDIRTNNGFGWASPLQTYLELMAGDQRDQETAKQVKEIILSDVMRQLE